MHKKLFSVYLNEYNTNKKPWSPFLAVPYDINPFLNSKATPRGKCPSQRFGDSWSEEF
jgi:hypothetical protein